MADLSDETLMAFADGELEPGARARVEALLAARPGLRDRLAVFEATGRSLAGHFRSSMEEPVPARLLAVVAGRASGRNDTSSPTPAQVVPLRNGARLGRMIETAPARGRVALAAAVALAIGVTAGWGMHRALVSRPTGGMLAVDGGRIVASGVLQSALEGAASGTRGAASGETATGHQIRMRLTFKGRGQGFCRHYEIAAGDGSGFAGIGCRDEAGRWHIRLHAPAAIRPAGADRTITASGADAAVGAMVEQMVEGDAFGPAEEAELIRRHWRR